MGSLRHLNGGEQQETETPETGTTVYYTHHATSKRSSAVFTCPKCGKHRLEKHFRSAEVLLLSTRLQSRIMDMGKITDRAIVKRRVPPMTTTA